MEAYLEDNRPTLNKICEEYNECTEECPAYEFCHRKAESKLDGDPIDIDKAVEHYEGTLEVLKGIDLEDNA